MTSDERQRGDILISWLLRLLVTVAAISLVVFEVAALVIASVAADEAAAEVARAGVVAYGATGSLPGAREAAEGVADAHRVDLVTFEDVGATLVIEVERHAGTVVLQHLPGTDPLVVRTGRREVGIGA